MSWIAEYWGVLLIAGLMVGLLFPPMLLKKGALPVKQLTPEQIELIRNIDSQKGLYAEAVLLGSKYQGLFRVIPPRYLLALLMNEKAEKAARHAVESQHDVLKAAEILAEQLENPVKKHLNERFFYDE